MGIFDDLLGSNQGGMNLSSVPNPSTAEIIFKLAQTLGPLAPYIGGRNSPMGRMIGAGSVLAGGIGGVGADLLQQQRTDPVAQKMRLAQQIQAMGSSPSLAGATDPETMAAENAAFALPGATAQSVVASRPMTGPPVFNPDNLSPSARLVASSAFPSLDPKNIAELEANKQRTAYYQQQMDDPRRVLEADKLRREVSNADRLTGLNRDFLMEVQAEMQGTPGRSLAEAGKIVRNRSIDKYGELAPNSLVNAEITNERELNERINQEQRMAKINNDAAMQRQTAAAAQQERSIRGQESRADIKAKAAESRENAKLARLTPSESADVTKSRVAVATVDGLRQAYDNFLASNKGGAMSTVFKGAIAQSANAQRIEDMFIPTNAARTPAEVALAAEYNNIVGSLRSLTSEKQLSNEDAIRNLRSFTVSGDSRQIYSNLEARRRGYTREHDIHLQGMKERGRNIDAIAPIPEYGGGAGGPPKTPPTQAEIEAAKILGITIK